MKQEIKDRWVAALRSGEFKQGRNCLRMDDLFCCLGVLTELYVREVGAEWREVSLSGRMTLKDSGVYYIPPAVCAWAGMNDSNPHVIKSPELNSPELRMPAAYLNDKGMSFAEIADAIERTPTDNL
jgi:hypothetical protein